MRTSWASAISNGTRRNSTKYHTIPTTTNPLPATGYNEAMDPVVLAALPLLAWAIFAAATALTTLLGAFLAYHWFRYAMNPAMALIATGVYAARDVTVPGSDGRIADICERPPAH